MAYIIHSTNTPYDYHTLCSVTYQPVAALQPGAKPNAACDPRVLIFCLSLFPVSSSSSSSFPLLPLLLFSLSLSLLSSLLHHLQRRSFSSLCSICLFYSPGLPLRCYFFYPACDNGGGGGPSNAGWPFDVDPPIILPSPPLVPTTYLSYSFRANLAAMLIRFYA